MLIHYPNYKRGSVLLLSAVMSFVLFLLALALFKILPTELHSAKRARLDTVAHYTADAGVKSAVAFLEKHAEEEVLTQEFLDAEFNALFPEPRNLEGDWAYLPVLRVNPDGDRYFDIESRAFFRGDLVWEIRTTVERQSFAFYALFIDTWPDSLVYGLGNEGLNGPFHTNQFFRLGVPSPEYWEQSGAPFVEGNLGIMTHSQLFEGGSLGFPGDGNAYYDASGRINTDEASVPFDEEGALEPRYQKIVQGGRGNIQFVNRVPLPQNNLDLLQLAWGANNNEPLVLPSDQGVHVNEIGGQVQGGVYVQGTAEVDLLIDSVGNQIQEFSFEGYDRLYRYTTTTTEPFPVYEVREVEGMVPEVIAVEREEEYDVLDHYRDVFRILPNGLSEVIQVPVYRTETRIVTVYVETGNEVPGTTGVLVQVDTEDRDVTMVHYVTEEVYLQNPELYPNAVETLTEGQDEVSRVVEVSEPEGYTIPAGATVDGEPITSPQQVPNHNTIVIDADGDHRILEGDLNGVTYVNGHIPGLKGISKGHFGRNAAGEEAFNGRIVTSILGHSSQIDLTGNLLQFYDGDDASKQHDRIPFALRPGELSPNSSHALGIVAERVILNPERPFQDIYAVILAGRRLGETTVSKGGFGVVEELLAGSTIGQFRIFGGVIEATALPWVRSGGMRGELNYDHAAARGLPFFPMTQSFYTIRYAEAPTPR